MKKILAIALALVMVLAMVACGGNTTKSKRSLTAIKHDGTYQS